jgi:transposase
LRRLLTAYLAYYHGARTQLALEKDAPMTRRVQMPPEGPAVELPEVGGLHQVEVFRRAGLASYVGRKSALYALIASVRPRDVVPLVRFEGVPGEFSQHDFGEVDVEYLDGTEQRVRFFASRLKYSRAMQVSLVPDQTVESLLRSLATHLATWGGAPLVCIFDRPKTVALKWGRDGVVTEWNATFAYAALELGIGVEVCWPYRAQEKGSEEHLVRYSGLAFNSGYRHNVSIALGSQREQRVNDERRTRRASDDGDAPTSGLLLSVLLRILSEGR